MLVLFSIFITLFLLCCAIVIDVGYWWANAKKAQIAADACALAAAQSIPSIDPTSGALDPVTGAVVDKGECVIETGGPDYVLSNIPEQGDESVEPLHMYTLVRWPYNSDDSMVEATVRMKVGTFFGRIVGLHGIDVERRAVAEKEEGDGNWAIYAHDPDIPFGNACIDGEGLEFNGNGIRVNGRVHSNSNYSVNSGNPSGPQNPPGQGSGDQFWALEGTINSSMCQDQLDPDPGGAAYGSGPEPRDFEPQDGSFEPWPAWYTPSQFGWPLCSGAAFSARIINIKGDKIELKDKTVGGGDQDIPYSGDVPSGTYCARESISTSDSVKGKVTLLSPQITIGGGTIDLEPFAHNILFFSVPNWFPGWVADANPLNDGAPDGTGLLTCTNRDIEMVINAAFVRFAGTIFHPCGRVAFNSGAAVGGNPQLVGTILGYKVKINMNSFNMIGIDNFGAQTELALVE